MCLIIDFIDRKIVEKSFELVQKRNQPYKTRSVGNSKGENSNFFGWLFRKKNISKKNFNRFFRSKCLKKPKIDHRFR